MNGIATLFDSFLSAIIFPMTKNTKAEKKVKEG